MKSTMEDIYIYAIFDQASGIVLADSKEEAKQKVIEAYTRHHDPISNDMVYIKQAKYYHGFFGDSKDILEICEEN